MYEKLKKQLLPILFEQKKDLSPELFVESRKNNVPSVVDKNNIEVEPVLKTLVSLNEGIQNQIRGLSQQIPYIMQMVGQGKSNPINPIIIAPQTTFNLMVNSNNPIKVEKCGNTTETYDSRSFTTVDARKKNCGNIDNSKYASLTQQYSNVGNDYSGSKIRLPDTKLKFKA